MMVYSLPETAKANGLNPQKYLAYLLKARLNTDMPDEELDMLAPWSKATQMCCKNKPE